ncbi:TetR/AcrR family transcriptional regulator [Mucilaginibacter sp. UR6-1]|uniref:TetR/AcrR family transcriptional regulator n=1 Tax=Mucilaginibacter sp. UR6-1 TaxID=1435643 RepID=UPI001E46151C|nr:TetR/AcrR family transcriptional regulator [Mucilaginibacter sp. UR6-1]MCC8408257.1 TetR/AcrR family transcriptional regulator [Mucilaginibacter sp. UR6-1]
MRTKDDTKKQLVRQKAIEIIVKDGLEGFTINKLAKACGISVGTPYVYYKDKDDLIVKIVLEEGAKMEAAMNMDFDPEAGLEEGLRIQWRNRFNYMMENPGLGQFFDQISNSSYHQQFLKMFNDDSAGFLANFKKNMGRFIEVNVERGEMDALPIDVYWSIAFGPLYTLMRFHQQGRSITGAPFEIKEELIWSAFDRVIKSLKN